MDRTFLILSTLCFLAGFTYTVISLRAGTYRPTRVSMVIMGAGFVLQCLFLSHLGQLRGRCPITNGFDILIFVSWATVLFYFLLGPPFRVSLLGTFTAPLVFLFQCGALALSFRAGVGESGHPAGLDPWFETHKAVALLAYGAFALACVAGVMYLVQDRQLKRKTLSTLFYNLPPINSLGRTIFRLLLIGLILLTVGIVSAFLMEEKPGPWHLGMTLSVWVLYAAVLLLQVTRGMSPRRMALGAVVAFLLPAITLLLLPQSH